MKNLLTLIGLAAVTLAGVTRARAADILWSNNNGSAWLTGSNWTGNAVPTGTDNAQFGANPVGSSGAGINFSNPTNAGNQTNGQRIEEVGAIELTSARASGNPVIGDSSSVSGATGTLRLLGTTVNSVSNVILRSNSGKDLTIQDTQASGNQTMSLSLGNTTENKIVVDAGGSIAISNVIKSNSGSTPLTVLGAGSGRVDITGTANTFNGTIRISGAEVRFSADGSLGNANNAIVIDGGRFASLNGATFTIGSTHSISVGDTAGTSISTPGAGVLTYNGAIADAPGKTGAWAKQGSGTLALGGVSTYTGATAVNNGILQLSAGNDRLPTGTPVSLGQAASTNLGTLDLNGHNQQVAGLNSTTGTATTGNNTVTSSAAATLTIGGNGTYRYGSNTANNTGIITGAVSVVKQGSGTQTLGGANTYTGTTTVRAGMLLLSDGGTIGTGNLVLGGGTFGIASIAGSSYSLSGNQSLTGSGTIVGAAGKTLAVAGALAPGSSPGTIALDTVALTLSGTSTFEFTDPGFAAGTYDLVKGTAGGGAESVAFGGTLDLNFSGGAYTDGSSVAIFDVGSYGGSFGTVHFFGLGAGQSATFDPANGLVTVVPEPKTWGLLVAGSSFMLWNLRRKRDLIG